ARRRSDAGAACGRHLPRPAAHRGDAMIRLGRRHWLASTALAAALHAALGVALFHSPPAPGAKAAGEGGITVELTAAGGSPGAAAAAPAGQTADMVEVAAA